MAPLPASNPWETAVETSFSRFNGDPESASGSLEQGLLDDYNNNTSQQQQRRNQRGNSSSQQVSAAAADPCLPVRVTRFLLQVSLLGDALLGLVVMIYCLSIRATTNPANNDTENEVTAILTAEVVRRVHVGGVTFASLLGFKLLATCLGLKRQSQRRARILLFEEDDEVSDATIACRQCGLLVSAYLSLILAIVYMTVSPITAYLYYKSNILYQSLIPVQELQQHLWILLLLLAVGECLRYQWLMQLWRRSRDDTNQEQLQQSMLTTESSSHHQQRPWWWSSSSNDYWYNNNNNNNNEDDASWFARLRLRRRRHRGEEEDDDARDDGSVDFASVQEEWAVRSTEDPHWWSRDEDHERNSETNDNNIIGKDLSWAKERRRPPQSTAAAEQQQASASES